MKYQSGKINPTKEDLACNAIREMFFSKQYEKRVPVKDIQFILKSSKWHRAYGKAPLQSAWKSLVNNGYVNGEVNSQTHEAVYLWGIEHNDNFGNSSGIRRV
jgi:hypothetical protein